MKSMLAKFLTGVTFTNEETIVVAESRLPRLVKASSF
jgi:hypothetical protein